MRLSNLNKILTLGMALLLAACNGGGGSSSGAGSTEVSGGGVKGPLAGAVVSVYSFDSSQSDFKSTIAVATGATDANAAITGLSIPFPVTPPYIMEFTSTTGTTTDITTGLFPVITTLRTVITQSLLDGGEQIYATPLTTMAVDIAVSNAIDSNTDGIIQADEFETALTAAATQVVSTLGFGMDSTVDIFDTPPLVDNTTVSTQEQANVAAYRAAVEAVTAIAFQINEQSSGGDTDSVLAELAADLADGGGIDGSAGTQININTLQVLKQDPATLDIPGSDDGTGTNTPLKVGAIQAILVAEAATIAPTTSVTDLDTGGSIATLPAPAEVNPDIDGDGVLNVDDAFPENSAETVDSDGDGIGDNADLDDDNDGILDEDENVVLAPTVTDTDGDGIEDANDNCRFVVNTSQTNTDGLSDGGDACDTDDDEDGVADNVDAFPLDSTESVDTDNDGVGDVADTDDDNDGLSDADESSAGSNPLISDTDGDGVFDGADFDPTDNTVTFNFAPVAEDDQFSTPEDTVISISVTDNDTDNDANPNDTVSLSGIGTNNAALGAIAINGNNIDYTPATDANGTDTFTYTVTDGTFSSTGTVSVTITPVNDNPVAVDDTASTNEDTPVTTASVLSNDTDVDGDTLSVVAGNPTATTGTVINHGDGTFTYTPNADFNGADSFTYTLSDGNGGSTTGTVNITVNAVNDAPISVTDSATTAEDTAVTTVDVTVNDSDIDSGTLSATLFTNANNGNVVDNGDGTFAYTPNANFNGSDSFTYTLSDGSGGSATGTVNITVTPVNDSPIGNADTFNAGVGIPAIMGVLANDTDVDGDSLSITAVSQGSRGGTVSITGSTVTFTDTTGVGTETFTYDLFDGTVTISGIQVTVTVTLNVPPVANGDSVTTNEDTLVTTVNVLSNDTDGGDGPGALTVTAADSTSVSGGTVTNNGDGTFDYAPAANFNGADSFTYTVSDTVSTSVGTVSITVTAVNDNPLAVSDTATTAEDTPVTTISVLTNDSDVEGDTLSVAAGNPVASSGAVVNNSDGTFTYTPNANFNGNDSFNYTLSDGNGGSSSGTVTITVTAVNDAPVAVNDSATTAVNTAVLTGNVLSNDTDVDQDTLAVAAGIPTAANGTVLNNNNGTFTYTPNTGFTGSDSFTYTVSDSALTDVGTVNITVNALGTAINMFDLFGATNGGVAGFDSFTETNGTTMFEYWSDALNSSTNELVFTEAEYNRTTGVFDTLMGESGSLELSAGTWVQAASVNVLSFNTGTNSLSVDVSVLDSGANELERVRVSARISDITGDRLDAHLNTDWQGAMLNPNLVFTTGSKLITQYQFEALAGAYFLFEDDFCEGNGTAVFTTLLGNCNGLAVGSLDPSGFATTLDQVIAASAWVDPDNGSVPPITLPVAYNEANNTTLVVQLVTGNVANYYFVDPQNVNLAQRVTGPTVGTWVRDTAVQGVDMIRATVPSSFKALFPDDLNEGLNKLLAVQNGFVRGGDFSLAGESTFDSATPLVNGIAKDQILANFSLPVSVLACGTESGTTVDPVTGFEIPVTPYTFAQFEGMVNNCTSGAGTVAITVADIKGNRFNEGGEISQFDNTGSGTQADPGHGIVDVGVDDIPIAWYLETSGNNTFIVLTASVPTGTSAGTVNLRQRIALTSLTAGVQGSVGATYIARFYDESDIGGAAINGTEGEIWNSSTTQVQLNNTSALACGTVSGSTIDAATDLPKPITPYTFAQFESKVISCGGTIMPAITVADIRGHTFNENGDNEITAYDNTGLGTVGTPGHGVLGVGVDDIPIAWHLETIGSNTYIVLEATLQGISVKEMIALTGVSGTPGVNGVTYTARFYTEFSVFGDNLVNGSDGEIWDSTVTQTQ